MQHPAFGPFPITNFAPGFEFRGNFNWQTGMRVNPNRWMFFTGSFPNINPVRFQADIARHWQPADRALLRLLSVCYLGKKPEKNTKDRCEAGGEQGAVAVLQVSIVTTMLFAYHPRLAWLALAPVPFLAAGALWYTLTAKQRYRGQRKASSAMNALLHDNLAGIRQIKTYVRESEQHERFNEASKELQKSTLTVMRIWAIYNPSMSLFASLGMTLVVGFGAQAVLNHELSVGE